MKNLRTIRDHLRFAISEFETHQIYCGHGTDNYLDEAYYLVFGMLNLPFNLSSDYLACNLTDIESQKVQNAIFKRTFKRIPTAYLVGFSNFCELKFKVDLDCLFLCLTDKEIENGERVFSVREYY